MQKTFLLGIFVLLLSNYVQVAYPQSSAGRIVEDSIYSEALNAWRRYSVYLPPNYDPTGREYPILYLLHGLSDTHTMWPMS